MDKQVEASLASPNGSEPELLAIIHKLHGSCAYCGVPKLQNICAAIETALRSNLLIESIEPELFELQDEMNKIVQAADEYL